MQEKMDMKVPWTSNLHSLVVIMQNYLITECHS